MAPRIVIENVTVMTLDDEDRFVWGGTLVVEGSEIAQVSEGKLEASERRADGQSPFHSS